MAAILKSALFPAVVVAEVAPDDRVRQHWTPTGIFLDSIDRIARYDRRSERHIWLEGTGGPVSDNMESGEIEVHGCSSKTHGPRAANRDPLVGVTNLTGPEGCLSCHLDGSPSLGLVRRPLKNYPVAHSQGALNIKSLCKSSAQAPLELNRLIRIDGPTSAPGVQPRFH